MYSPFEQARYYLGVFPPMRTTIGVSLYPEGVQRAFRGQVDLRNRLH